MRKRERAWSRWLVCKRALGWLRLANGSIGDWYWTPSEDYHELIRRGFVDAAGRVTEAGKRAAHAS